MVVLTIAMGFAAYRQGRYAADFPSAMAARSHMIVGTEYSPGKAFINFARDFIRALAQGDFSTALAGLDTGDDGHRWSKSDVVRQLS